MTDILTEKRIHRMDPSVKIGLGIGILFMLVMLFAFWILFIKPLEFAGKAAVNGLSPANQSGAMMSNFSITINAKGDKIVIGTDPQKMLHVLKEAKPVSAHSADSKPETP